MSQIETIMLITLGLVVAALLALLIGRMVWSYSAALSKRRTDRSAPATIAALQSERDQLRAQSAMQTRKLELRLDDLKTRLAEQSAEVSRNRNRIDHLVKEIDKRDEVISDRDSQIQQLNHHLEPLEIELATRTEAVQQLKELLREREDEMSSNSSSHDTLKTELARRDDEIARLRAEVADREARQKEISIEAETAQERLQSQIRELTALSGQIEKQRSDMSEELSEFTKSRSDSLPSDDQATEQEAVPASVRALTSSKPAVKEKMPTDGKAKSAAKKTKPAAKKAKSSAKKAKPAAKTDKPAGRTVRSETESAKFASQAARAAAQRPKPAIRDVTPTSDNSEQGSILAAMRKKSIGLTGNSPDSISRASDASRKVDENVNYLQRKGRDLDQRIDDAGRETSQLQDELKQLDAVWAKKIAALSKAAPEPVSARARAENVEKALAKAEPADSDQPASSRSRQNVISLAARIRALQKKSVEN